VAAHTVAFLVGMRSGEARGVAGEASSTVILDGLNRLVVGIVVGSAPKPAAAIAGAGAEGQLLDMTDNL